MAFIGQRYVVLHPGTSEYGFLQLFTVTGFESGVIGRIISIKIDQMCGIRKMKRSGSCFRQTWFGKDHSAFVFQDNWITGGMVPPPVNDVWSLVLPND